ncbi:MAG: hypothetical protein QGG54_20595, partial [Gammaproteobacteria bacterium]|nr:hypothetical protein [Gammaproteobacteria bacterium]
MRDLHWSLDYSAQPSQSDFRAEFSGTLASALATAPIDRQAERKIHRYMLLPNFWGGFKHRTSLEPGLNIGDARIERTRGDVGDWHYHVEHSNRVSGEDLSLEFTCRDEPTRPLRTPWHIRTHNSGDGSYSSISWTGTSASADGTRTIVLTTERDFSFPAGTVADEETLTCSWA